MATIGEAISRIRNGIKAVREESFITDRFIYSLLSKYASMLIERDNKIDNIFRNQSLFKDIPYVELIDADIIDTCYTEIDTGCKIKRSRNQLPIIRSLKNGPVIRYVTSIDRSIQLTPIIPARYNKMKGQSTFKYNKNKYYWIIDNYIYVPDVEWDAVSISAIFDEDISDWLCSSDGTGTCNIMQDSEFNIPEHLLAECENLTKQELMSMFQIPVDTSNDKQNISR